VLGRGYAIATGPTGEALLDAAAIDRGDVVRVRLHRGAFRARVLDHEGGDAEGPDRDPGDEGGRR
jgi:exonuclease VII large subunit